MLIAYAIRSGKSAKNFIFREYYISNEKFCKSAQKSETKFVDSVSCGKNTGMLK
jgi:archaellum biogenesis protein FlaJ (TadC family)